MHAHLPPDESAPVYPDADSNERRGDDLRDASRGERLQRVLADAGIASRRACEQLIEQGRVTVNGRVVRTLPAWVDPRTDHIRVDGNAVPRPEPHLYIMLNKPARSLATPREGPDDARASALDLVRHPLSNRLFPAGRLDFEATGLLLLTNDGDLAHRLTHARYGVEKTYQMVVRGTITDEGLARVQDALARMLRPAPRARGKDAGPTPKAPRNLVLVSREAGRTVLELTSSDSRAGEVRDALAALGHPVKKLERVAIGPVRLSGVALGHWRELERDELTDLRRAALGKAPRRAGDPDDDRPKITKRFRGIGRPVESAEPSGPRRARAPGGPSARARTSATPHSQTSPTPVTFDARKGRGNAINAYRRKPAPKPGQNPKGRASGGSPRAPAGPTGRSAGAHTGGPKRPGGPSRSAAPRGRSSNSAPSGRRSESPRGRGPGRNDSRGPTRRGGRR